mmetsp:Transcript_14229/g.19315  ORF Transcript_14229/g.19315 Transcript_14229/m.19315 type:complete len:88 (+) Transcript_14229:322-585(+)
MATSDQSKVNPSQMDKNLQQAQLEENAAMISSRSTRNEPNTALIAQQTTQLIDSPALPPASKASKPTYLLSKISQPQNFTNSTMTPD